MKQIRVLSDGRRIAIAEFGRPDGTPVVALHGTPGSCLKFAASHSAACRHDVRLIAVDRWGYGDSAAPRAARTLEDYAKDIGELADCLGVERFSLLGISGGGPFAAVTAGSLGQRVTRLALIAPVGPIAGERDLDIDLTHRLCFRALPRTPLLIAGLFQIYRGILRASPRVGARLAGARGPAADKAILRDPDTARTLGNAFRHGMRDGTTGPVIDLSLFARPWPAFTLRCDARMWLGTLDRNIPRAAALRMAHAYGIPVTQISGAGHFWFAHNADATLEWLAGVKSVQRN